MNKLKPVFNASVIDDEFRLNIVIVVVDQQSDSQIDLQTTLTRL